MSLKTRIILAVCAGTAFALIFVLLFLPSDRNAPTLPDELLLQSQGMRLENLEDEWRARIAAASASESVERDDRLAAVAAEALDGGRLAAAWHAASNVGAAALRANLLNRIFERALGNCADLAWASAALKGLEGDNGGDRLAGRLAARIQECQKRK